MKISTFRKLLVLAFIASSAASASAQSVSFTNSVTAYDSTNSWNIPLSRFDTNLGTLTGVEVKVNFSQTGGTFSVTNTSGELTTDAAFMNALIQGSSTNLGFTSLSTNFFSLTSTNPVMPFDVPVGTTTVATVVSENIWTNVIQTIDPSFWSAYLGGGTVDFQVFSDSEVFITAAIGSPDPSNIALQTSMTVTYSFVPEPSTYALLTLAGVGLAGYVIRRRR